MKAEAAVVMILSIDDGSGGQCWTYRSRFCMMFVNLCATKDAGATSINGRLLY